jgi:hypothetical protein
VLLFGRVYEEEEVEPTFVTFLEDHCRVPPSPDQGKSIYSRRYEYPLSASLKEHEL